MAKTFREFKDEVLRDSKVKAEYEALEPKFRAEKEKIKRRIKRQMAKGYKVMAEEHKKFVEESFPLGLLGLELGP